MRFHVLRRPFIMVALLLFMTSSLAAQRNNRSDRSNRHQESWPPEQAYSRLSLGSALQQTFAKHYDFCGFPATSGRKRDFTPPSIERFLGQRNLRTRVEQADISGGLLMNYIFSAQETSLPLDEIRFRSDHLLALQKQEAPFLPQAREGFDAFVMTKNCSGYLNACLEAGIDPPYAAFRAALASDERRESSVLALAGSFNSPLEEVIAANDARTNELMAQLWLFYQEHPELNGQAYYLREFEGMLVRHLSSSNDIYSMEQQFGVNVNLPFAARFNTNIQGGRTATTGFEGTDWQTIVYTDFNAVYRREGLFTPLPRLTEVVTYLAALNPTENNQYWNQLLEGTAFTHRFTYPGLPAELAGLSWNVSNYTSDLWTASPSLSVAPYTNENGDFGLQMDLKAMPDQAAFHLMPGAEKRQYTIDYVLEGVGADGRLLRLTPSADYSVSGAPLIVNYRASFDLNKQDDQGYSYAWLIELEFSDEEHPIDYDQQLIVAELKLQGLPLQVTRSQGDALRHRFIIELETLQSWPLMQINTDQMTTDLLELNLGVPTKMGEQMCVRQQSVELAYPAGLVQVVNPRPAANGGVILSPKN